MQSTFYPGELAGRSEATGKAFAGSLIFHGAVVAVVVTSGLFNLSRHNFGSERASSGSVGVNLVSTIPIPRREAPTNALANDSESDIPQKPVPVKLQKQVKAEPEKAIEIPDKAVKPRKLSPKEQMAALLKPPEAYKDNQVFSTTPQRATSPLYGVQGSNGIDVGQASVLGERFGAYGDLVRDRVAQHWNRANVHSLPSQKCAVSFTIARNGTVSNVQVSQPSGDYLLDTSAKRAILDTNPLPPLPQGFERNEATVELWFQLKR
ncbi:MAG TPA: TonB family protein [Bryobacteraceae bacterium]|nr:TonB family protein [Bryobacteraceae bacterium]